MRPFLLCVLPLLLCTCAPPPAATAESPTTERPNVLFILTDDQGIGDLSSHDNDSISTPHMDAILNEGVEFTRFYVSPVCAPTRASFLSGFYHPRTGAISVTNRLETMDDEIKTVAEYLQGAGYRTGLFGKWHNGATFPYHPAAQGFGEFLGFTMGHFNDYFNGELKNERDEPVPFRGDLTQILTDTAAHFMLSGPQPFFCMLTYQAPHTPVQVADAYWDRKASLGLDSFNTGVYAMIESVDDRIGQLMDTLKAAGKLDHTIVVFATDNGPNGYRYRMGLKGVKGHVDEGGVRVPFGIRLPAGHPANGRKIATPAAHIDLLPTLLELTGIATAPEDIDGKSLLPLLAGDTLPHRYVFAFKHGNEYTGYPGSMRDGRYLYVAPDAQTSELYDLANDPGQKRDIFAEAGELGRQLATTYRDFAPRIGRPDRVAPPIDLLAAPASIRLLAHEGQARGEARFREGHGWANDFFIDLGPEGVYWPVTIDETTTYAVRVRYHSGAAGPRAATVVAGAGNRLTIDLPPARTEQLPVADRLTRKEVYPRRWAEREVGRIEVPAGTEELMIRSPQPTSGEEGLWIKEVRLDPVPVSGE
jgi:arylsulfatase A